MKPCHAVSEREEILAKAIGSFAREMRLVDLADFVAHLRLDNKSTLEDLIETAAELHFFPGTIRLGDGGEAQVDWSGRPRVLLELEMRLRGITAFFCLALEEQAASVELHHLDFVREPGSEGEGTLLLQAALADARIVAQPLRKAS